MEILERFLNYVRIETGCVRNSTSQPSNFRQFDLIHLLVYELNQIGITDTDISKFGVLYVNIPASEGCEAAQPIGFVTHLDTFPEYQDHPVQPQIIPDYDGEAVALGNSGLFLRPEKYPYLKTLKGQTLITTDGTTLLGADDKAGIAEIMAALERIVKEEIPHGPISLAFVPDEEIGLGIKQFEYDKFHSKLAFTIDGWEVGEIVYSNFNAAKVTLRIHGKKTHTGKAKGLMINAQLVGVAIQNQLPAEEIPAKTDGEQGFYHLLSFDGSVAETTVVYQIRDLDDEAFMGRIQRLKEISEDINREYGEEIVEFSYQMEYRNMKSQVLPYFHLIDHAVEAAKKVGVTPNITSARGGTIGARLSYEGVICPNLGIGGDAYHGPMEYISVEAMDRVRDMLVELIRSYGVSD